MKITNLTPVTETLRELGRRLAKERKRQGYSQDIFAKKAGIGVATLRRMEKGQSAQIVSWLKIQLALDAAHALNNFIPESVRSPREDVRAEEKLHHNAMKEFARRTLASRHSPVDILQKAQAGLLTEKE